MSRRVGLLVLLAVVLLVGGAVALVLSARPALRDDRDAVDVRWAILRGPLTTRYQALGGVADALTAAGAGERTYTVDLAKAVADWDELTATDTPDTRAEADLANELEGLAARVRVNVAQSARLGQDAGIVAAFQTFDAALVPPPAVRGYNRAVERYEDARDDTLKRIPADLLGFDARPILVIAPSG